MQRRRMMQLSLAGAASATLPSRAAHAADQSAAARPVPDAHTTAPLRAPASGAITVAFLISTGAEVVDFTGPWGVFEYVILGDDGRRPFKLVTVGASKAPIAVSSGLMVLPDYTFADAPAPDVIVVPALDTSKLAPAALDWLKAVQKDATVTMSVCNGSFVLADAGLLDGKRATAHHGSVAALRIYPKVTVLRGLRYVEDGKIATSGGLTSGVDLAMRIVERYFGREVATKTARRLEYQGTGWMHPESNAPFGEKAIATAERPLCPVCETQISRDKAIAEKLTTEYQGKTYYFCGDWCRKHFVDAPARFV